MKKISQQLQALLGKETCLLATADATGKPNIAPKGSMMLIDDQTLGFAEIACRRTFENIKKNPSVEVLIGDLANKVGYRLEGQASFVTEGPIFDIFNDRMLKMGRPKLQYAGVIKVTGTYDLRGNALE